MIKGGRQKDTESHVKVSKNLSLFDFLTLVVQYFLIGISRFISFFSPIEKAFDPLRYSAT